MKAMVPQTIWENEYKYEAGLFFTSFQPSPVISQSLRMWLFGQETYFSDASLIFWPLCGPRSAPAHLHTSVLAPSRGKYQKYKWGHQWAQQDTNDFCHLWIWTSVEKPYSAGSKLLTSTMFVLYLRSLHPWHNRVESVRTYCACLDDFCLPWGSLRGREKGVD